MRKDIRNTSIVPPIVHKPRNSQHKTFGENVVHGDFTFNNNDYENANKLVRIFGHSKFIRMFWRLFFPMLIYGFATALVPILFMTMAKGVYEKDGVGIPIYESFTYTLGKFNYINIFVALAWTLMAYPIVGHYIGRNQPHKMQESVRFVFYMIMVTCSIAMIFECIYAPDIAQNIVWKYKNITAYNLTTLHNQIIANKGVFASEQDLSTYLTNLQRGYQLQYSIISIRFFAFTSYLVGWASLFTPMFSSRRNNKVLIFATITGLIFFLIVYSAYIYTNIIPSKLVQGSYVIGDKKITKLHDKPVASYSGYQQFDSLIKVSCGIYIAYNIVIPVVLTLYCTFPKQFKIVTIKITSFLKNLYNSLVDKQSNIEYQISRIKYKKYQLEQKIKYYQDSINILKETNNNAQTESLLSTNELNAFCEHNQKKIQEYESILSQNETNWMNIINQYEEKINSLQIQFNNTPVTNKKLFYIDYSALENIDEYEKNFLWFNGSATPFKLTKFKAWLINKLHFNFLSNRKNQLFTFKVSNKCARNVWKTSAGLFINQFCFGVFQLAILIYATNFNGNLLGLDIGTTKEQLEAGKEYYKLIVANASLIMGYLGMVYNGFVLLPQYFVAYYIGRGDKETAYHNSLFLTHWSFIVGLILCAIVLIYASFINYIIYPNPTSNPNNPIPVTWTGAAIHGMISYKQFWLDCFWMELILAIVIIFDTVTGMTFFTLATGACKWTFFSDQFVRIINIIALICLYYGQTKGVHWFNYEYSANMFIYYMVARSHSVIPGFISWVFIERGWALRSIPREESESLIPKVLVKNKLNITK